MNFLDLFAQKLREKREQKKKVDEAVDAIRAKFGNSMITRASIMQVSSRVGKKAKAQMENETEAKKDSAQ